MSVQREEGGALWPDTETCTVTHTLRLCSGVHPGWWQGHYSLVSPTRAGLGAGQGSAASQHGRTAMRWVGPGPFITPVVWGPGTSLLLSLCLCLHQINGPGPTEEVFQSAPPAKIVHHPDSLLLIMALIHRHRYTNTHVQMFIWLYFSPCCCGFESQATCSDVRGLHNVQLSTHFPITFHKLEKSHCISFQASWTISPLNFEWSFLDEMDETQSVKCLWDFCPQAGTGASAPGWSKERSLPCDASPSGGTQHGSHPPPSPLSPSSRVHLFWEIFNDRANSADMTCTHIKEIKRRMGRCMHGLSWKWIFQRSEMFYLNKSWHLR